MEGVVDWLIVGGGSAGCVLAARLSEDPSTRVLLLEAGKDFDQSGENDLTDVSAARAFMDPRYFQPDLRACLGTGSPAREPYKQAMLMGGGSSINGQIALRGSPDDYDHWEASGAKGWGWDKVLPYFRKLEHDMDFADGSHGADGPVVIRRIPRSDWDSFTHAVSKVWTELGYEFVEDMNGSFGEGHGALPLSNDGRLRSSTVRTYLTEEVRSRRNLTIKPETRALRICFEDDRAVGVEAWCDGRSTVLSARNVILSAGALRTPQVLQLSGIGDGEVLGRFGIPVRSHRRGVGRNLQDHPNVVLSGCLTSSSGWTHARRSVSTYLRYSSNVSDCDPSDMVMSVRARSMWHAVGARICGLLTYVALPASRGTVTMSSLDPQAAPEVDFNGLSDERDLIRLRDGLRFSARVLMDHLGPGLIADVFPARLSRRIELLSRPNLVNNWLSRIGAAMMDSSSALRSLLVRHAIANGDDLAGILQDDDAAASFVRTYLGTSWHPCGTCRMGSPSDPWAVVDPDGAVLGTRHLHVVDASVMPRITRTNTNLPTIMIAEYMADRLKAL